MSSAGWPRTALLFDELLELDPAQRAARMRTLRREDAELAAELERLLAADATPPAVLDRDLPSLLALSGRELEAAEEDLYGRLAGAYRLTHKIGSGGMGTVYAAERADGLYTQRVAVKVLSTTGSPDLLRGFARERAILATLVHPNIARLLDAGSLDEHPYLLMELVEGESLVAHCDHHRADLASRLRLFRQVCEAVSFAHRRLVVHRDLKPSNVLVGAQGEVKLLDFGIASLFDPEGAGDPTVTSTRRAFTPAYAAPEQMLGQPVTTATDVYSLGALLHELLVGRPPEPAWQPRPSGTAHLTAKLAALTEVEAAAVAAARGLERRGLARQLRGDVDAITATALRSEPAQRYGSADALAEDVGRFLAGQPVAARGPDRAYRARLFARRHRAWLAASMLALISLVGGLWMALAQAREARSEALRASALRRFLIHELKRELMADIPMGPGGPTVGYVFDHGLPTVDETLASEPEVVAEIFSIAGETYRMIGADERAVAALRGALARKRALYEEGDPRLRMAGLDLAHALIETGRVLESGLLLEALERETRSEDGAQRQGLLAILGEQRRQAGNLAGAEAAHREALDLCVRLRINPGVFVDQLNRLATVLYLEGKYWESEQLLAREVAIQPRASRVKMGQVRQAYARHRGGDLEGAQTAYRQALAGFAGVSEPHRWPVGYVTCGLGLLLAEAGEESAAQAMLTAPEVAAAVPDDSRNRGFGDPGIPCPVLAAWARDDLAGVERELAAGKGSLRAATQPDRDLLLAEMLLSRGRAAEALPLCNAAVRARDASAELQPWRRAEAHLLRGLALCRLGKREEGLPEVSRSAAVLRARLPRHRFLRLAEDAQAAGG